MYGRSPSSCVLYRRTRDCQRRGRLEELPLFLLKAGKNAGIAFFEVRHGAVHGGL